MRFKNFTYSATYSTYTQTNMFLNVTKQDAEKPHIFINHQKASGIILVISFILNLVVPLHWPSI